MSKYVECQKWIYIAHSCEKKTYVDLLLYLESITHVSQGTTGIVTNQITLPVSPHSVPASLVASTKLLDVEPG